jgi:RNase P subunit RPR2
MIIKINYCKDCNKPLYVKKNVELLGFDINKYCRSNLHFNIYSEIMHVK